MSEEIFFKGPEGEREAEEKCKTYCSLDPFPSIPPALLNSADIRSYVIKTGMISPFNSSIDKLKSATYEIDFIGEVHVWNTSGKKTVYSIKNDNDKYTLEKNSIAYFWTDVKFRIPDYIALRFNLRITHVHRGILLGTGPLIDPGFEGHLLIPLHNLTTLDYEFRAGEGLIWVEFTKLSQNKRWDFSCLRDGNYHKFPPNKKNLKPENYFQKASNGNAILSSIPEAAAKSQKDAEQANHESKEARKDAEEASQAAKEAKAQLDDSLNRARNWSIAGAIALVLALFGLSYQIYSLVQDNISYVTQSRQKQEEIVEKMNQFESRMNQKWQELQDRIQKLEAAENAELRSNLSGKPSPVKPGR